MRSAGVDHSIIQCLNGSFAYLNVWTAHSIYSNVWMFERQAWVMRCWMFKRVDQSVSFECLDVQIDRGICFECLKTIRFIWMFEIWMFERLAWLLRCCVFTRVDQSVSFECLNVAIVQFIWMFKKMIYLIVWNLNVWTAGMTDEMLRAVVGPANSNALTLRWGFKQLNDIWIYIGVCIQI
jgi:hypothetical protein